MVYNAVPYLLSPILGNPLALAAVNVDRKAPLATQVCCSNLAKTLVIADTFVIDCHAHQLERSLLFVLQTKNSHMSVLSVVLFICITCVRMLHSFLHVAHSFKLSVAHLLSAVPDLALQKFSAGL